MCTLLRGQICAGTILASFEHNWLKSSYNKNDTQRQLVGKSLWLGFRIRVYGQYLGSCFRFRGSIYTVGFSLQFTYCKQEAVNCVAALNQDNHHPCMGLSFYRCHGQLIRTCAPNLSCDYFNQSCLAEGEVAPAVILLHKAK